MDQDYLFLDEDYNIDVDEDVLKQFEQDNDSYFQDITDEAKEKFDDTVVEDEIEGYPYLFFGINYIFSDLTVPKIQEQNVKLLHRSPASSVSVPSNIEPTHFSRVPSSFKSKLKLIII